MGTDDFTRLADPALWDGLTVTRIEFRDDRAFWRLYRIDNAAQACDGPLWFVPHDNENAAFQAAIYAVARLWRPGHRGRGGALARRPRQPDERRRRSTARSIDPNRNFRDEMPAYARRSSPACGKHPG